MVCKKQSIEDIISLLWYRLLLPLDFNVCKISILLNNLVLVYFPTTYTVYTYYILCQFCMFKELNTY